MKKYHPDTIVALATPSGHGGIGIIRLSGPDAKFIAARISHKRAQKFAYHIDTEIPPRHAQLTNFYDQTGSLIDQGLLLFFPDPHSFTGEDVIELQAHGSPIVMDMIIQTAISYGARIARPGEFSERAFLNGKIDLAQAEAIADLIHSHSEAGARSAIRSLQGEFSNKIRTLQKALTNLRLQIEARIDFPEEEMDFLSDPIVNDLLRKTVENIEKVKNEVKRGALLQSGLQVVIVGKPNAGKSSLLNYLTGRESAIVTDVPGTTRDILRESIQIDGIPLHIVDTAGLRDTEDAIEKEGVRRAYGQLKQADLILLVVDAKETPAISLDKIKEFMPMDNQKLIVVKNKIDLTDEAPEVVERHLFCEIKCSLKKNMGIHLLIESIKKIMGYQVSDSDGFIARRRHVDAIERAYQFLLQGQQQLHSQKAGELLAEDLRQAQYALSEITGEFTSDDLLGEIFSSFCIGK